MVYPLQVNSEIGKLRTVLLHRPGAEVENLTPDTLERLLFDDIPYLPHIQKEHDLFADTLRKRDAEVVYLEKLMAEALYTDTLRTQFVDEILQESETKVDGAMPYLKEYLLTLPSEKLVDSLMTGMRKTEVDYRSRHQHLHEMAREADPFILDPMPNLYFTRDPAATIANGISINRMTRVARKRESLFMQYIIKHHPRFAEHDIPIWFNRDAIYPMEGGDQLVLSREVVAVGISERTRPNAIEQMAIEIFKKDANLAKVVAIEIPKKRAFMHLDTVFTMVDYDKFTIHPEIQEENGSIDLYILERSSDANYVRITKRRDLFAVLREVLHVPEVALIPCGGGDPVAAAREQWNDGSNTLAIAPGVVVTYDRNYVSNTTLRNYGIEVIEIASSELARGRGGPRCMSMPLFRDEI